jgi:squalene-hopene/tetraprenyl-beta-curcumene cyclase
MKVADRTRQILIASACLLAVGTPLLAKQPAAVDPSTQAAPESASAKAQALVDRGLGFLKTQQLPDGGWASERQPPAITALVLRAFVRDSNYSADTDFVKKGFDRLLSFQMDDGGIYKDLLANYNTAISVSALARVEDDRYQDQIDKGVAYLRRLQWTPDTRPEFQGTNEASTGQQVVKDEKDPFYGGWGYGGRSRGAGRPDLSNVQMTLDALRDAGVSPTDPAMQRALAFVSRLQNFSETNDQPWAGNDGGFVYGPSDNRMGESFAGETTSPTGERGLRSYGSMTYAGLKSFIYAGLSKDDPRVVAAWGWITSNFTLTENPGMRLANPENAQHGLYYYYHTLARTLNEYDQPTIKLADGSTIDWRVELVNQLATLQQPDGSWVGDKKWMEDNKAIVTSYVINALQDVKEDLKQHPVK